MFKEIAANKQFWQKVREDLAYKPLIERLYKLYDEHCKDDIPSPKYSLYKLYFETGDRNIYEKTYFSKRIRLNTLAILSLIYPENSDYIVNLQNTIWAICDEYSWVVPAHLQSYPQTESDTVDLFSSETAFALSEIKFLLADRLDALIVNRINHEVKTKVLEPYKAKKQRWEEWQNNWAAVCAASVGASFIYQAPEEFSLVKNRISSSMDAFLAGYKYDGACPEGLSYWEYGFGFYIWYADLLAEFTNGEDNLFESDKIKNIADFAQKTYLTKTVIATFSDATPHSNLMVGMCHFLKTIYGDDFCLPPTELKTNDHCGRWCHHIRSFVFYNPQHLNTAFDTQAQYHLPDTQWFIKRTPSYSFAIKGGHNDEPHNHNDVGSFILASGDSQIIADLGCGEYTADYFRPDTRYGILCNSSFGHSVPIINGNPQHPGAQYNGCLTVHSDSVVVDMKNAYEGKSLKTLKRTISFRDDGITLSDSFDFLGEGSYVCRLVSLGKPTVNDGEVFLGNAIVKYDKERWEVNITTDIHTSHITHEKTDVYLIDFKPLIKQNSFSIKVKMLQK